MLVELTASRQRHGKEYDRDYRGAASLEAQFRLLMISVETVKQRVLQ